MFDTEPRFQTRTPEDTKPMTLDEFQKECDRMADAFKADLMRLLEKGAEAQLNVALIEAIFTRAMEKIQQ